MTHCSHCQISPEVAPKIRGDVAGRCLKSRNSPCLACEKLLQFEQKIEETRHTLEKLLKEREELASALNEYHDPFLNRLPVEIVSHIFALSRPYLPSLSTFDFDDFDEKKNMQGVLNPGKVCRNWRTIAHHTPELWTVFGAAIESENSVSSIQLSLDWLERSGGCPLFVWLRTYNPSNGGVSQSAREFLTSVAQHAHRWKVLDFQVPIEMVLVLRSATAGTSLACLEHILLDTRIEDFDGPYTTELPVSPLRLTLEPSCGLQSYIIDLSKLTHFTGYYHLQCTIHELVHLFNSSPNLLLCDVGMVIENFDQSQQVPEGTLVTHGSLRTLHILTCSTNFWDYFDFPSLQKFSQGDTFRPQAWSSLLNFLRRSTCKITDLSLMGHPGPQETYILDTLKVATHVEQVQICGFDVIGCLLPMIATYLLDGHPEQSNAGFLPKLRAFSCRRSQYDKHHAKFDWSSLVDFIIAGTSKDRKKLESVEICFDGWTPRNHPYKNIDQNTFKQLLDATRGLDFRMVGDAGSDFLERLHRRYEL